MDTLLQQHSILVRCLRQEHSSITVDHIEKFFDRLFLFLKTILYRPNKTNGLDILTIICDDLASINTLQFFNHPILINHQVFIYIGQTLEMLLTKSNHSQSISMKKHDEDAFYSISYLVTQLCLYRNEHIESFYGRISSKTVPITEKPNIKDPTINSSSRQRNDLTEKLNFKVACLHPNAPKARPIEHSKTNLKLIPRPRKYSNQLISSDKQTTATEIPLRSRSLPKDLPVKTYQDVFLTSTFLHKLQRGIDDLSQNEYPSYHVKYKVIDRLVRLCCKMNVVESLCDSIVKCLCSQMYYQVFLTIEQDQVRLTPKQLFFLYRCPQFIIRHEHQQQEQILRVLCPAVIANSKLIIDQVLPDNDQSLDSSQQNGKGLVLHALSSHLELLRHLSLTSSGRRYFLQSSIYNQILRILHANVLLKNACDNEEFFHADVTVLAHTLMFLCNLAYEKTIFLLLKGTNFRDIYKKLQVAKDSAIKFAYSTLTTILDENDIDEDCEPMRLKQECMEFLQENIPELKQHVNLTDAKTYENKDVNTKYVFLTKLFLDTLTNDIRYLSTTEDKSNSMKYKSAVYRVRVCTKQATREVESLLNPIIECLRSEFYLKVFENIELTRTKAASGAMLNHRTLAPKHIFFMRECPEFLIQHDNSRKSEVTSLLRRQLLENTIPIFEQHISVLTGKDETDKDKNEEARIEALSYHVKLLNHFAMQQTVRQEFLRTSIIEDIITILQNKELINHHGGIGDKRFQFIGQSLTLLYNLALDKQMRELMKSRNLSDTCSQLRLINDKIIQFTSQILLITLNANFKHDLREINSLAKTTIEYVDRSIKAPKLFYQGIKLSCLLKDLRIIVQNDGFTGKLVEDKDGVPAITKCVSVLQPDKIKDDATKSTSAKSICMDHKGKHDVKLVEKIQHLAVDIVWTLSFYGPSIILTLKRNDTFIDQVLRLSKGSAAKPKRTAEAIIWRLGSEKLVRLEQTQKEEERARNQRDNRTETTTNESVSDMAQWDDDDTVPFDLLISYSNSVNDKILSLKIADRLQKRNYRVYTEKQGKHRLEVMQIAANKRIPILACLSSKFRKSKFCMAEVDYASKLTCPIIPVIVEESYTMKGWLNHIFDNREPIKFTNKNFNEAFLSLIVQVHEIKHSL